MWDGFCDLKPFPPSVGQVLRITIALKKVGGRFCDSQLLQKKLEEGFVIQNCSKQMARFGEGSKSYVLKIK